MQYYFILCINFLLHSCSSRYGLCLFLPLLRAFYLGLLSLKLLMSSHGPLNFSYQNCLMIALLYVCFSFSLLCKNWSTYCSFNGLLTTCFLSKCSQGIVAQRVLLLVLPVQAQQKVRIGLKNLKQLQRRNHQRRIGRRKRKWQRVLL
jgi:hypothetical protein